MLCTVTEDGTKAEGNTVPQFEWDMQGPEIFFSSFHLF